MAAAESDNDALEAEFGVEEDIPSADESDIAAARDESGQLPPLSVSKVRTGLVNPLLRSLVFVSIYRKSPEIAAEMLHSISAAADEVQVETLAESVTETDMQKWRDELKRIAASLLPTDGFHENSPLYSSFVNKVTRLRRLAGPTVLAGLESYKRRHGCADSLRDIVPSMEKHEGRQIAAMPPHFMPLAKMLTDETWTPSDTKGSARGLPNGACLSSRFSFVSE